MGKRILLTEFEQPDWRVVREANEIQENTQVTPIRSKDGLFLVGKIQAANTRNGNGRIYPRQTLEREITKYQRLMKESRALGELDHPEESIISLSNVSHMLVKAWWSGDDVIGKIKILESVPSGKVLAGLINDGVKLGISSRGLGSLSERNGDMVVGDDFDLKCFDMVHEPSTPNAFMGLEESMQSFKGHEVLPKNISLIQEFLRSK